MRKPDLQYGDYISHLFPEYKGRQFRNITFQITDNCNLCCSYCYQINKNKHVMPFETAKKFIDYIFDNRLNENSPFCEKETSGFIIEFIGGEPLLEIELVDKICSYFEERLNEIPDSPWNLFHIYSFSSNGVLYRNPKVQAYLKKFAGLANLNITLDGNKELHDKCRLFPNGQGSYDLALDGALDLLDKQNQNSTKLTFSPDNVDYVYEGLKNIIELGFTNIYANCVFEDVWNNPEDIKKYYSQLKQLADFLIKNKKIEDLYVRIFDIQNFNKYDKKLEDTQWCGTTSNMFALDWKGDIYSCLRFMESSLGKNVKPLIIGNVDRGIGTLPEEQEILNEFACYTKGKSTCQKCKECLIESGCSWCVACSYQMTGSLCRTTTTCEVHKAEYLATLYLYKQYDKEIWENLPKVSYDFVQDIIDIDEYDYLMKGDA